MKLHEYQAKELLASYGVQVPRGGVATTPQQAKEVAERLGGPCVVKAQIHAGARGKAGGIRLAITPEEAEQMADAMLGHRLVTAQTGPAGAPVNHVLVEEALDAQRELYVGIVIDGVAQGPVVVASSVGGVEIEETAERHPDHIFKEVVDTAIGLRTFQVRRLTTAMGLSGDITSAVIQQLLVLNEAFTALDCSLAEINPLVITKDVRVIALDAKLNLDDDALFRHQDMAALRDWSQDDPLEAKAGQAGIAYVKLDGDVGCLVNGAGLAMATMDIIKASGSEPANFLDVGGGANPDRVAEAVSIILEDAQVARVLVNVFGGIARCDDIARGIVQAVPESRKDMPIVVRLLGTNLEEGKRILQESGLNTYFVEELAEAAQALQGLGKS